MKCELSDVGIDRGVKGDGWSGDGLINRQALEVSRLGVGPGTASTGAAQETKTDQQKGEAKRGRCGLEAGDVSGRRRWIPRFYFSSGR